MSQSLLYGIAPNTWKTGPDFYAARDETGKWTGGITIYCRKFDFKSAQIQAILKRGVPCTTIYPELTSSWSWFYVDSVDHEHKPGGITEIRVKFTGTEAGADGEQEEKDLTYTLNGSLVERSILEHPDVKKCYAQEQWGAFSLLLDGTVIVDPLFHPTSSLIKLVYATTRSMFHDFTDTESIKWFKKIFLQGERTWECAQLEWTMSGTNLGGIKADTLKKLGFIDDDIKGEPPTPQGCNWRMMTATESRTDGTEKCTSSFSIGWLCSPQGTTWDADKYTYKVPT
jgi:hypothetical protein